MARKLYIREDSMIKDSYVPITRVSVGSTNSVLFNLASGESFNIKLLCLRKGTKLVRTDNVFDFVEAYNKGLLYAMGISEIAKGVQYSRFDNRFIKFLTKTFRPNFYKHLVFDKVHVNRSLL